MADILDESAMLAFARTHLGQLEVVADLSWPHGESKVLHVSGADGQQWIIKQCRQQLHFDRECNAFREWVPALGHRAPRLISCAPSSRTLILTFVAGDIVTADWPSAHAQAGALIRKFHEAVPARPDPGFAQRMYERLETTLATAGRLFSPEDIAFVRQQVADLRTIREVSLVPTHQDNQPRNWLIDETNTLTLIDFGLSTWDVWVRDLIRLHYWDWQGRPDLAEAFLDGYGRVLTTVDQRLLRALGALTGLRTVVWAFEHGDDVFAERGRHAIRIARDGTIVAGTR